MMVPVIRLLLDQTRKLKSKLRIFHFCVMSSYFNETM